MIANSHVHLLERARVPASEAVCIARALRAASGVQLALRAHKRDHGVPLIDLRQQSALFADLYPKGFQGDAWQHGVRGVGAKRHLKRHRDHVIQLARETLNVDALRHLIDTMATTEIMDRIRTVLDKTDLVAKSDKARLEHVSITQALAIATSLENLLRQTGDYAPRMQRWIDTLRRATGAPVSWPLATALPALIDPDVFPWVRPTAVRTQAKSLDPELKVPNRANGAVYARIVRMVAHVADHLRAEGLTPTDCMDVTDFIWSTLRPASRKRLKEMLSTRQASTPNTNQTAANAA